MASTRLHKLAGTILCKYKLARRQSSVLIVKSRAFANESRSVESNDNAAKLNTPLKFTGSKAQIWRAQQTRSGSSISNELWYQPYVIILSLSTFMIYFFILREENDIDQIFDKTLYDHIEGLEEQQVELALEYNRTHGIKTDALEARLKEIRGQ